MRLTGKVIALFFLITTDIWQTLGAPNFDLKDNKHQVRRKSKILIIRFLMCSNLRFFLRTVRNPRGTYTEETFLLGQQKFG